ncbi:MAG: hydroxysqualene dehydroxylase HpnE [Armatimonadetes bacterium]|nr:hydroxysqualene dehydroxylase HpnE [Armatimonadota bacterium]
MHNGVAVIGGGIAGLACACDLVDAGLDVVLLEAKNNLGGRAYSFRDVQSGATIDNCQHVLMGCCDAAIEFLAKIGSLDRVEFRDTLRVIGEAGETLRIRGSALPAPLHLAPSILRTNFLTGREKLGLARVAVGLQRREPKNNTSAADYLKSLSCPSSLLDKLVGPILVSALNEEADVASAAYARMMLSKALLESRDGYRLGVPTMPLSELIDGPASRYLAMRGAKVRLASKVERVNLSVGGVESVTLANGRKLEQDAYVCAVPPWSLNRMDVEIHGSERLGWHAIVGVHLFFGNLDPGFDCACVVGEPFQWVFNKSADFGMRTGCIQAVASAADGITHLPKNELVSLALRAAERVAGKQLEPSLRRSIVCRTTRATFSTAGEVDELRPPSVTAWPNLFLAGDWTDTRWPATIESAVRSGKAAARAVIASIGK